jgi:hypothetical protein
MVGFPGNFCYLAALLSAAAGSSSGRFGKHSTGSDICTRNGLQRHTVKRLRPFGKQPVRLTQARPIKRIAYRACI